MAKGTTKDFKKALYWYEKVAFQGEDDIQYKVGKMYQEGIGVEKDVAQALYWYKKAGNQGNEDVMFDFELLLPQEEDLFAAGSVAYQLEDYSCALEFFEEVAQIGNSNAQYICGVMYLKGEGTEVQEAKALYWLEESRNQGNKSAKELLDALGRSLK